VAVGRIHCWGASFGVKSCTVALWSQDRSRGFVLVQLGPLCVARLWCLVFPSVLHYCRQLFGPVCMHCSSVWTTAHSPCCLGAHHCGVGGAVSPGLNTSQGFKRPSALKASHLRLYVCFVGVISGVQGLSCVVAVADADAAFQLGLPAASWPAIFPITCESRRRTRCSAAVVVLVLYGMPGPCMVRTLSAVLGVFGCGFVYRLWLSETLPPGDGHSGSKHPEVRSAVLCCAVCPVGRLSVRLWRCC
jgi:hypothetical protein